MRPNWQRLRRSRRLVRRVRLELSPVALGVLARRRGRASRRPDGASKLSDVSECRGPFRRAGCHGSTAGETPSATQLQNYPALVRLLNYERYREAEFSIG
jgi:hypothetical protein